jgi:hypothetical protein
MSLTADRDTPHRYKERKVEMKMAAATTIYMGHLVCADADGNAVAASDAAGLFMFGRAEEQVANPGAAGAKVIPVAKGVFKLLGSGITQANVGDDATVVDSETVGLAGATTHDIIVGRIEQVDSDGVWVAILKSEA